MDFLASYFQYLLFCGCVISVPLIYLGFCKLFKKELNDGIHLTAWIVGLGFAFYVFQIGTDDLAHFFNTPTPCDTEPDSAACMEYLNQDPYEDAQPGGYRD